MLSLQYRMAASIQLLANTLVYNGQLQCGSEAVANAQIRALPAHVIDGLPPWIVQVRFVMGSVSSSCGTVRVEGCAESKLFPRSV